MIGEKLDCVTVPKLKARTHFSLNSPVAKEYYDVPRQAGRVLCWHALLTIMVNNNLMQLSEGSETERTNLAVERKAQNCKLSKRIWSLSEEARASGLMRYYFYPGSLVVTWDSADSEASKQWIVNLMNDVLSSCVANSLWTHTTVQNACDAMSSRI